MLISTKLYNIYFDAILIAMRLKGDCIYEQLTIPMKKSKKEYFFLSEGIIYVLTAT